MAYYKPIVYMKKRSEEINGSHHLTSGLDDDRDDREMVESQHFESGSQKKYACFKCDRFKLDYYSTRTCTFKTKSDGSPLNTQEVINRKIGELKVAKKRDGKKKELTGSSSFVDIVIVTDNTKLPS